jgi:16S rRNA (guanine(966)-N(2))-methyltransferase RsmD
MKNQRQATPAPKRTSHQIRIIGGQWKRSLISVVDAEGLRPTPDRVRETVFNWLGHLFNRDWAHRNCLDLFAGSGALGWEAASRGVAQVTMTETNPAAFRQLQQVQEKLGAQQCRILRSDAMSFLNQACSRGERFDLIFLDPPFHHGWLEKVLPVCATLLTPAGLIYAESETPLETGAVAWLDGWEVIRADKAGSVFFHILQRNTTAAVMSENQA